MTLAKSTLRTCCRTMLVVICGFSPTLVFALSQSDHGVCDAASAVAASETGVPVNILRAVSRVESGRSTADGFHPWPWAVNMGGQGRYFTTRQEAHQHVARALANGATNIDLGCFQINHRWHRSRFPTLAAMFEPRENARYAARFLHELFSEFGDWDLAIGAYHSRTPVHRSRYLRLVQAQIKGGAPATPADPAPQAIATWSSFSAPRRAFAMSNAPRSQASVSRLGSLFASGTGARAPLVADLGD